jgi:hypothetical protein
MEIYAALYPDGYEFLPISGALIFLALFVACFLAWKAVERLRNRGKSDAVAQEDGDPETHQMPWNQADYRRSQYFRGEWSEFWGHERARARGVLLGVCPPQRAQSREGTPEGA